MQSSRAVSQSASPPHLHNHIRIMQVVYYSISIPTTGVTETNSFHSQYGVQFGTALQHRYRRYPFQRTPGSRLLVLGGYLPNSTFSGLTDLFGHPFKK